MRGRGCGEGDLKKERVLSGASSEADPEGPLRVGLGGDQDEGLEHLECHGADRFMGVVHRATK